MEFFLDNMEKKFKTVFTLINKDWDKTSIDDHIITSSLERVASYDI